MTNFWFNLLYLQYISDKNSRNCLKYVSTYPIDSQIRNPTFINLSSITYIIKVKYNV